MNYHHSTFLFDFPESQKKSQKDLIKLVPFGISLLPDPNRPVLILKSEDGEHILPVALNPLEAGVTLTQFNKSTVPVTPHRVAEKILGSLDIKITKCVFVEIKGHFQYVRLHMSGNPQLKSLKCRADEAMSLCLHLKVDFFAPLDLVNFSKTLNLQNEVAVQSVKTALSAIKPGQGYMQ